VELRVALTYMVIYHSCICTRFLVLVGQTHLSVWRIFVELQEHQIVHSVMHFNHSSYHYLIWPDDWKHPGKVFWGVDCTNVPHLRDLSQESKMCHNHAPTLWRSLHDLTQWLVTARLLILSVLVSSVLFCRNVGQWFNPPPPSKVVELRSSSLQ